MKMQDFWELKLIRRDTRPEKLSAEKRMAIWEDEGRTMLIPRAEAATKSQVREQVMEMAPNWIVIEACSPGERTIDIVTKCLGFVVTLAAGGGGKITSDLHEKGEDDFNLAIDAIESIVVAHACAGIDITDPRYLEGIETAVEACANNAEDAKESSNLARMAQARLDNAPNCPTGCGPMLFEARSPTGDHYKCSGCAAHVVRKNSYGEG